MKEQKKTICNRDCPDACGILATVEDGRVTRLGGDPAHPVTKGFLCYRTSHFLARQYSPLRLTAPLLRKNGELEEVSWEEAFDFAAKKLLGIKRESGPAAIFHYRSGGSLGMLKMVSDYFFEKFGPVTTKRGDICSGAGDAAQLMDFGEEESSDVFDLFNAKNILVWGKNVYTASPHLLPILKECKSRGAGLVLIDPVWQRTATLCDAFYQPRPGGDFALAMAVARILFEEGWIDPEAERTCDQLQGFRALAEGRPVATWCQDADVAPEAAWDLARRLFPGAPATILVGWGMGRRQNGAGIVRALDGLCAISGNLGRPGGGASFYYNRRSAFDASWIKGSEAAPRTVCEPLFGAELLAKDDPPIRAVWVTAGNPVAMLPDSHTVSRALSSRDFVVVVDSFLTDTARLAHLVLPTTTLLEDDDLLGAYGHHMIGVSQPVAPPPPGVKSDLEILQGLAARVGLAREMAGAARSWKRRFLSPALKEKGVTLESLEEGFLRNPLAPKVVFQGHRFSTPSGRVNLITAPPPDRTKAAEEGAFPLWLLALSTERSQSSQQVGSEEGPATVRVHPEAARGIPDGALCRLESAIASLEVRLAHDPRQRRDVALMEKGGSLYAGRCANALVRAKLTDLGEGGALYEERVRLVPESREEGRGERAEGEGRPFGPGSGSRVRGSG